MDEVVAVGRQNLTPLTRAPKLARAFAATAGFATVRLAAAIALWARLQLALAFSAARQLFNSHLLLLGLKLSGLRLDPEPCALRVGESIMLRVVAQQSRLLPPRQTKRLCKRQAVPAWGIGRPFRGARCARSSRECHRWISTLSSRPVFSLVASTCSGERAASTLQGDLSADAHRDQLAGECDHTCICVNIQPAHSCAWTIIHRLFQSLAGVRPLGDQ